MSALPKWYEIARGDLGIREIPGPQANARILELARHAKVDWYKSDETHWCSVAANGWLGQAGYPVVGDALARSFEKSPHFRRIKKPYKGCIATFWRVSPDSGYGHVGLYERETSKYVYTLGGNQSDSVNISANSKAKLTGYWEPVTYNRAANDNAADADDLLDVAGAAKPMSPGMFTKTGKALGCDAAMVAATWQVEAGGKAYFPDDRVKVLPERHRFYKNLPRSKRRRAVKLGLAVPKWSRSTQYKDLGSADACYELLKRWREFDETAMWKSFSMGAPQIMGENARLAGFRDGREMFLAFREGVDVQFEAFISFVRSAGLVDEMQRRDFKGFTRGYNGKGQVAKYSARLKKAYLRFASQLPSNDNAPQIPEDSLSLGDTGAEVKLAQTLLNRFGYRLDVDGEFGPMTKQAVVDFQRRYRVDVRDHARGVLTPMTIEILRETTPPADGEYDPDGGFTPEDKRSLLGQIIQAIIKFFKKE